MAARSPSRALGPGLLVAGLMCIVGLGMLIVDMAESLPLIPAPWWKPHPERADPANPTLRAMVLCPGPIGWLGGWALVGAWLWLAFAGYYGARALRTGVPFTSSERIVVAALLTLLALRYLLLYATPLQFAYPFPGSPALPVGRGEGV